ncbi:PAS domain-containing protein, partial [Vibrio vulnificus]|uniref:PAS domain-containing protein n=1 Tax=Vibrio vulnificus TaxID=672 RepID=UPI0019D47462|nr:PAS domain-containing protein [Vibrio vulnificus]
EDREWVFNATVQSTETGSEVDYEYRIFDAGGRLHWVRDRGCLIRNENGNIVCREGVIIDITEQKLAQEELRLGEER